LNISQGEEYEGDFRGVVAADADGVIYSVYRTSGAGALVTLNSDGTITEIGTGTGITDKLNALEFAPDGILYALGASNTLWVECPGTNSSIV